MLEKAKSDLRIERSGHISAGRGDPISNSYCRDLAREIAKRRKLNKKQLNHLLRFASELNSRRA